MAKRVYKPHPVLEVSFSIIFLALAILYSYCIYVEGRFFWTLVASTAIVTGLVWIVEKALNAWGKWFSHRFLNDERHQDPLSKVYALKKFVDQGWQLVYHTVFSIWEYIVLRRHNWFQGEEFLYPVSATVDTPYDAGLIFIVQISLWFYQAFRHVFVNQRKKDFYELFLHHIVTLSLCYEAYHRYYKHGLIILFLHDSSDILVDSVKMLNLCKIDGAQDYFLLEGMYAMTLIVWIYQRLYIFPKVVIEKAWMVLPTLYPGLSFGEIFKKEWVLISEFGCVSVLYLLHWYWFVLLVRLGYRALLTEREKIREIMKDGYEGASDDESDDEEPKKRD
ncbi:hypothetical protein WA556_003925 [Blastocystis sp. ATCC 50177/Nand II]